MTLGVGLYHVSTTLIGFFLFSHSELGSYIVGTYVVAVFRASAAPNKATVKGSKAAA